MTYAMPLPPSRSWLRRLTRGLLGRDAPPPLPARPIEVESPDAYLKIRWQVRHDLLRDTNCNQLRYEAANAIATHVRTRSLDESGDLCGSPSGDPGDLDVSDLT